VKAFAAFIVSFYDDNKVTNYYEVLGDNGSTDAFTFTVPADQEAYLGVQYYDRRMYANNCLTGNVNGILALVNSAGHMDTLAITDGDIFSNIHYTPLP
jgi:hypothetical protein